MGRVSRCMEPTTSTRFFQKDRSIHITATKIHQIQWELQEQVVQLSTTRTVESTESSFEDPEVQVVLDSIQSVQTDTVKHIETETEELLRLWVTVHQKQDSVEYFEEENIQFWSDIFLSGNT